MIAMVMVRFLGTNLLLQCWMDHVVVVVEIVGGAVVDMVGVATVVDGPTF